ncbi:hypothetical protein ASD45_15370 [Pseudolabrys sp. Root1462]|jgi:hypothetical protein|uniref:hypothetical protein n=1 Tax=Pseudolabrys sp. Root1462 TaxID=1736466 RepID=UPI00070314A6|nr:hypothetical protein [Pseudolabrys sp. Root1462]KQZ02080.1 hypothetical protein ASD45_15370 [Pseudolabrys sp. Root1462]
MIKTNTKIALAAALLAAGFTTSAFASDASEVLHQEVSAPVVQQQTVRGVTGSEAYAFAPAARVNVSADEQREFDRATAAALSQ